MIFFTKHRIAITFVGAGLLLILGSGMGLFDAHLAFMEFPSEIIILIIVLSLFTEIFKHLSLIDYIGYHFIKLTKGNRILIMIFIPILMYITSLFMNNLTVVLLFTYMALYMVIEYDLPVIPLLVSIIIGSNIGGAPLPWADTPAVVLSLYTDFTLFDFLDKLFIPCLIFVLCLSFYTYIWYKYFSPHNRMMPFNVKPHVPWEEVKLPLFLFVLYIIGISAGPFFNISIAYISLFFGGLLLLSYKTDAMDLLNSLPILDSLVFIIALFLIGGVLECSGILTLASNYILSFTNKNPYFITLAILLIAFVTSTLLSAGPTAATLLPICQTLTPLVPSKLIYAALALGILCGSSMLPWSATGGPILLSQVNSFLKKKPVPPKPSPKPHTISKMPNMPKPLDISQTNIPPQKLDSPTAPKNSIDLYAPELRKIFKLKVYLSFSVPFAIIMLLLSSIYLTLYIYITL